MQDVKNDPQLRPRVVNILDGRLCRLAADTAHSPPRRRAQTSAPYLSRRAPPEGCASGFGFPAASLRKGRILARLELVGEKRPF